VSLTALHVGLSCLVPTGKPVRFDHGENRTALPLGVTAGRGGAHRAVRLRADEVLRFALGHAGQ